MENKHIELIKECRATILSSIGRVNKATKGLEKETARALTFLPTLGLELARPSLSTWRGAAKIVSGYADLAEGSVSQVRMLVAALPGIIESVRKAQDARGVPSVKELNALNVKVEGGAAKKEGRGKETCIEITRDQMEEMVKDLEDALHRGVSPTA